MTIKKENTQSVNALVPITADNLNSLTCPEFKRNVNKMIKAEMSLNKDMWTYAIAVNNIVVNKYYEDDCKTLEGFAERMGVKKGSISKYSNSVTFMVNVLGKYGYDMTNLSYTKAYLLSTLKEDIDEFISSNPKDLSKMTMRELEEVVKAFKDKKNGAIETKSSKEEKEETETEETETELPSFTGRIDEDAKTIFFSIKNKNYVIPFDELKHYKVK